MRTRYVMCIDNKEYPVSLTLHKVYRVIPDARGEDYLFAEGFFVTVNVPEEAERSFEFVVA